MLFGKFRLLLARFGNGIAVIIKCCGFSGDSTMFTRYCSLGFDMLDIYQIHFSSFQYPYSR